MGLERASPGGWQSLALGRNVEAAGQPSCLHPGNTISSAVACPLHSQSLACLVVHLQEAAEKCNALGVKCMGEQLHAA